MTAENFETALACVLKAEGGFSNDEADHGGRTMRGITQREYDAWCRRQKKPLADVKSITDEDIRAIYRQSYWDAVSASDLPGGLDLTVFDFAVNSGPERAVRALQTVLGIPQTGKMSVPDVTKALPPDTSELIDKYCDARAAFLRRIGTGSQSVFLRGWLSRVKTVRAAAKDLVVMAPSSMPAALKMGDTGAEVLKLQIKLRALQYPAGAVDGSFGPALRRAVLIFQDEHDLNDERGAWLPGYWSLLDEAGPLLPERQGTTEGELRDSGDSRLRHLSFVQRWLSFLGLGFLGVGGSGAVQSFPDTLTATQQAIEPIRGLVDWASGHWWLICLLVVAALIAVVRFIIFSHVQAYRNFDYQGAATPAAAMEDAK
jgi:lysozyme family protein